MKLSKNPTSDEIKRLAELPYGEATTALIENGHWDWSKDPDYSEYEVELVGTVEVEVYASETIWAKSKKEAVDKILERSKSSFSWHEDGFSDHEIDDIEATAEKIEK